MVDLLARWSAWYDLNFLNDLDYPATASSCGRLPNLFPRVFVTTSCRVVRPEYPRACWRRARLQIRPVVRAGFLARGYLWLPRIIANPTTKCADFPVKDKFEHEPRIGLVGK